MNPACDDDATQWRPGSLYERDRVLSGAQKLRFFPAELVAGRGSWLIDAGGRQLLDLSATWTACALGHGHPAVVAAVSRAVREPPGAGAISVAHPAAVLLAEMLLGLVPGDGDRRVYLGHAGSDANDVALRACRHATGRRRIVSFAHSYHGGLGLAQGVSGVQVDAGAPAAACFVPYPDPLRPHNGAVDVVADSLERVAAELANDDTAAVIVEPILSDGGLVVPPSGFMRELHAICRRYAVPLICDEVKVGLGRTGLLHAFQHDGVAPDIVTFGKALGGGLPMAAAVGPAAMFDEPAGSALLTTVGNPVCSAAGLAVLRTIIDEDLPSTAARAGARLVQGLREAVAALPGRVSDRVGDIRGKGLAVGIDLVTDNATLRRDPGLARMAVYRAWQLGAVVFYVGGNVLEVTPPLTISDPEIDQAVDILGRAIHDAVDGRVSADEVEAYAGW